MSFPTERIRAGKSYRKLDGATVPILYEGRTADGIVKDAPVEANLKDGVLKLRIPLPEQAGPKQIEIQGD